MRFVALRRAEAAVAVGAEIRVASEECATRDVRHGSGLRLSVRGQPQFDFQAGALSTRRSIPETDHGTGNLLADSSFVVDRTRSGIMAGWRQAVALAMTDGSVAVADRTGRPGVAGSDAARLSGELKRSL